MCVCVCGSVRGARNALYLGVVVGSGRVVCWCRCVVIVEVVSKRERGQQALENDDEK